MHKMIDQAHEIAGIIKEVCPPGTPDIDDFDRPFVEYGLDSLDLSALFLALEEKHGVQIDDDDFEKLTSVNSIVAYLKKHSD